MEARTGIKGKILIVDDNEGMRRFSYDILSLAGYEVQTAANGYEALLSLEDESFDLVITDVEMGGLDGISLYRSAVESHPCLKESFIFMTGSMRGEVISAIRGLNKKCIMKPFRRRELLCHVDLHIAVNCKTLREMRTGTNA